MEIMIHEVNANFEIQGCGKRKKFLTQMYTVKHFHESFLSTWYLDRIWAMVSFKVFPQGKRQSGHPRFTTAFSDSQPQHQQDNFSDHLQRWVLYHKGITIILSPRRSMETCIIELFFTAVNFRAWWWRRWWEQEYKRATSFSLLVRCSHFIPSLSTSKGWRISMRKGEGRRRRARWLCKD